MAKLYNMQRVQGVVLVPDGTRMFNNRPVIGIRDVGNSLLFADNQRVMGIDLVTAGTAVYNDLPVLGAVRITDGRSLYGNAPVVPVNGSGEPDFVFQTAPWRISAQSALLSPTDSQLTEMGDLWCPPIKTGGRIIFLNWQRSTGAAGTLLLPGNSNILDFVNLFTSPAGAGFHQTVSFDGNASATMENADFVISDPLSADFPGGYLRLSITTPSGGKRPRWYSTRINAAPQPLTGEVRRLYPGPQPALATSGALTGGTPGGTTNGYTPALILAPADGSRSFLLLADSLQQQDDDFRVFNDARGNFGYINRALDDAASTRMQVGNFGIPGNRAATVMAEWAANEGVLLGYIKDRLNNGRWPFHGIISALLTNDFSALGDTATQDKTRRASTELVDWIGNNFPGLPIWQTTVSARTASAADRWTTLSGQTPTNATIDGALRESFNASLVTNPPRRLTGVLDFRSVDYVLDGGIPKHRLTPWTEAGGGTLPNAVSAGLNLQSAGIVVQAATAPEAGHYLVLTPGDSATVEQPVDAIASVASAGTNLWLVKTGISRALTKAHAAGAIVRTARTNDGTHWSPLQHKERTTTLTGMKAALGNGGATVDPDRYMFFATRAREPSGAMTVAADGTQFKVSLVTFGNAPYRNRKFTWHYSGFALNESGTTPVESLLPGNATTIHKSFLLYGGNLHQAKFAGADGAVIASGTNGAWVDELALPHGMAANGLFGIVTIYSTAAGENQLPVYRMSRHRGERIWGAASLAEAEAMLADLTQPSTPSLDPDTSRGSNGQPYYYGPDMMVAKGDWDGRPVLLATNDSIGDSRNDYSCSFDQRGNAGWLRRWLDDQAGPVGRIPHFLMGVPGQQAFRELSEADGSLKRWSILDELIAMNAGKWPFTAVFNQMGQNDTTSAAAYQARVRGLVERIKARYPGVKVVQGIPMGRTTSTDRYMTTANQTFEGSNIWPNATKWQLRDYIMANTDAWHDGYIDTFAAWSDPVVPGKWPEAPTQPIATVALDFSGTSYSFVSDRPIPDGQYVSLGNVTGLTVGYSVPNGDGTYLNSIANGSTASVPAGTPIYVVYTNDGVHPSRAGAIRQASRQPAADKSKFVFPPAG